MFKVPISKQYVFGISDNPIPKAPTASNAIINFLLPYLVYNLPAKIQKIAPAAKGMKLTMGK